MRVETIGREHLYKAMNKEGKDKGIYRVNEWRGGGQRKMEKYVLVEERVFDEKSLGRLRFFIANAVDILVWLQTYV